MSGKFHLHYFNGRGLGEVPRLLLSEAGADWEDHRFEDLDPALKATLPFGQVPLLEHDGKRIVQSVTISRYIARLFGLYGKTEFDGAQADYIVDGLGDLRTKFRAADSSKDDAEKEKFAKEVLPQWLGYFENILAKNGNGYIVPSGFTYADVYLYHNTFILLDKFPGLLEKFPHLAAHYKATSERPNIAAWLAKRPNSPW